MSARQRPPRPQPNQTVGDVQLPNDVLAALLVKGGSDQLEISADDRQQLYDLFPQGYALVIYEDQRTGAIRVTLTGEQATDLLGDLLHDAAHGRWDRLPPSFRPGGRGDRRD